MPSMTISLADGLARAVERATEALRHGGVVVLPTDTVYGLAALPTDRAAVDQLFALKARQTDVPIAVLCADADQALSLARVDPALRAAAERWWPGPLTLVASRRAGVELHLGDPPDTVGLRVPDHDLVRGIARSVGPIATTSANRHGKPTAPTAAAAASSLAGEVSLVVDGGRLEGSPSTVIDATDRSWRVLRAGPLPAEAICSR